MIGDEHLSGTDVDVNELHTGVCLQLRSLAVDPGGFRSPRVHSLGVFLDLDKLHTFRVYDHKINRAMRLGRIKHPAARPQKIPPPPKNQRVKYKDLVAADQLEHMRSHCRRHNYNGLQWERI